ncbi:MAG: dihydrodipicolinate synthase family protein, partial [Christensenella sp.]
FLIRRGVHCLYPCGTTGEMYHMSVAEREKVAETVVHQAAGRATVYIHAGAMCQEDTLILARHAVQIGADGVGVVTPSFFCASDRELVTYYQAVSSVLPAEFPLYLYNIPQCAANDLTTDVVMRIVDSCPNIVGIKYSLPDFLRTDEYIHVAENFSVMQGTDRLFLPMLAMGCDGTVSGVSNVYPELFVAIYNAYLAGNIEKAREYQIYATQACNLLHCGCDMSYFKNGLSFRGFYGGHMRAPQLDLTANEVDGLYKALTQAQQHWPKGLLLIR